mgnify:CR=1 FL=1
MSDFLSFITEKALILIPVLYILGIILKNTEKVHDKYIPLILLPIGIIFSIGILGLSVDSVIQGILITGASVYVNQLIKQQKKVE